MWSLSIFNPGPGSFLLPIFTGRAFRERSLAHGEAVFPRALNSLLHHCLSYCEDSGTEPLVSLPPVLGGVSVPVSQAKGGFTQLFWNYQRVHSKPDIHKGGQAEEPESGTGPSWENLRKSSPSQGAWWFMMCELKEQVLTQNSTLEKSIKVHRPGVKNLLLPQPWNGVDTKIFRLLPSIGKNYALKDWVRPGLQIASMRCWDSPANLVISGDSHDFVQMVVCVPWRFICGSGSSWCRSTISQITIPRVHQRFSSPGGP